MMHTIAYELSGSEAALTALTPVPDGTIRVSGNDFFVPPKMGNILWAAAEINSAAATLRAQIQSPSLRATVNLDISPIINGLVAPTMPGYVDATMSPYPLVELEPLDVFVQNGAAVMNRAILTLGDGPTKPTSGKMYTVRATASITLATATWANGALTFSQTLPAGNYQVVGLRVISANGVAARLFFVGSAFRPGVLVMTVEANTIGGFARNGSLGVWDQFNNVVPPSLDVLGVTDTAQIVYLDLIKVS